MNPSFDYVLPRAGSHPKKLRTRDAGNQYFESSSRLYSGCRSRTAVTGKTILELQLVSLSYR